MEVGKLGGTIASGPLMVIEKVWVGPCDPVESDTEIVKGNVPPAVGVPEMTPVEELSERPGGRTEPFCRVQV